MQDADAASTSETCTGPDGKEGNRAIHVVASQIHASEPSPHGQVAERAQPRGSVVTLAAQSTVDLSLQAPTFAAMSDEECEAILSLLADMLVPVVRRHQQLREAA